MTAIRARVDRRRAVALAVIAGVAANHVLRLGSRLRRTAYHLYYGYASDVLVPLAGYFVLCLNERSVPLLGDRRVWDAPSTLSTS